MPRPWPQANVDILRAFARAGWTLKGTAGYHGWPEATVQKHAATHGIEFAVAPPSDPWRGGARPIPTKVIDNRLTEEALRRAKEALAFEISMAVSERSTAPLYRRAWPDGW